MVVIIRYPITVVVDLNVRLVLAMLVQKKRNYFEANSGILLIILEIDLNTKAWFILWLRDSYFFSSFHVSEDYDTFYLNQSKYEVGVCKCVILIFIVTDIRQCSRFSTLCLL